MKEGDCNAIHRLAEGGLSTRTGASKNVGKPMCPKCYKRVHPTVPPPKCEEKDCKKPMIW